MEPSSVEFEKVVATMYPDWLVLGDPECEGCSVDYLDMTVWYDSNDRNHWNSKLYDKRVQLVAKGLKLNKFPHPKSKLSMRCKLGVITSQLHRFNIACTRPPDFIQAATTLYTDFIKKGYKQKPVDRYFESFRRRHTPHLKTNVIRTRCAKHLRLFH